MVLVDERIGSRDLLEPLKKSGVPCELARLEFGDFSFIGRGPDNRDIYIGVELKETRDLISSLRSSRFAGHQLPGLQTTYDRAWLLSEGIWRAGDEGVLETWYGGGWKPAHIGKHRIMASDLESWVLSQVIRGGLSYWHCSTRRDTIRFIAVLYSWWTKKEFSEHRSHQAIYLPPPDRAMLVEPTTFLKVASCLPGVGWEKAAALEDHCQGSVRRLCAMTVQELREVDGIGKKIAQQIVSALDTGCLNSAQSTRA